MALAAAALACWWVATTVTAQHPATAIFGMRGRYNGLAALLAGLAVFLFLATTRATERDVERRLAAIGIPLTLASAYALVQEAGLDPFPFPRGRPASTLGHPVIFAGVLAMFLPFTLALALGGRSRSVRLAASGMALVQGLALTLTLARGPWIGAACGAVVFAVMGGRPRRALARHFVRLAACGLVFVAAALALSGSARAGVLARLATISNVGEDASLAFRVHFCRAAIAMLRDHPVVGVGLENYGLLYARYRAAPTAAIGPDLVPMMVHSGPVQTAVSGGIPALVLQAAFLGAVLLAVIRRWRGERDSGSRLLGAAFAASLAAYCVQDLSGWPHVALGGLAFAAWGLAVAWSLGVEPAVVVRGRWPLAALGAAVFVGGAWMSVDTGRRLRADRLMFEAQQVDVRSAWDLAESRVRAALDLGANEAWASDAAAKIYSRRAATGDRSAYVRAVELANAARAANPFDPYIRLRRAELDLVAMDHGLLARMTDEGRDALAAAKSIDAGSALVHRVEASLARKAGASRITEIAPQSVAGFGPAGSLVVSGSAPETLAGALVFLHWRNATRNSAWSASASAAVVGERGAWYSAIPNAKRDERYEAYATFETRPYGPCTYAGTGGLDLCAPVAWIGPQRVAGFGPPGSLIVAGAAPAPSPGARAALHWRRAGSRGAWVSEDYGPVPGLTGAWYGAIPNADPSARYEAYVTVAAAASEPCVYDGKGSLTFCAPTIWIQPGATAGFGPAGSLVVAGAAPEALAGIPVYLHWRNATRQSAWTVEAYAPPPDAGGVWYNFIPNAAPGERYQVYLTSAVAASNTCAYAGDGARSACP